MASESRSIVGRVAELALEERLAGLLPPGRRDSVATL